MTAYGISLTIGRVSNAFFIVSPLLISRVISNKRIGNTYNQLISLRRLLNFTFDCSMDHSHCETSSSMLIRIIGPVGSSKVRLDCSFCFVPQESCQSLLLPFGLDVDCVDEGSSSSRRQRRRTFCSETNPMLNSFDASFEQRQWKQ